MEDNPCHSKFVKFKFLNVIFLCKFSHRLPIIISRLLKHPGRNYYQCTLEFRLEMMSELTIVNQTDPTTATFNFHGFDPKTIYASYKFSSLFFVYFLPLFCIIFSFVKIVSAILRCLTSLRSI